MPLSRVTGQERAKAQISAWLAAGRLPHAVLITGREGVGKRRLALELARAILCRRGGDGCGVCPSCVRVEALGHPDLHVLLPLPTGAAHTGTDAERFATLRQSALDYLAGATVTRSASNIAKEHVLLVQREMSFTPTEATRRVALVFEADRMLAAGANSLLKILEEPPRHAVFLLVSAAPDRLLPTVVSRCQRLSLRPLTAGEVRRELEGLGVSGERAVLAARLAVGNQVLPADVADEAFDGLRALVERFLDSALRAREEDYWALLDEFGGRPDKQRMEAFLELCSAYLRDLFLIHLGRSQSVAQPDRESNLAAWARAVDVPGLDRVARVLDEAYDSLARNVAPQLLLADLWDQLRRSAATAG